MEDMSLSSSSSCHHFSLDEIKEATDNFDEKKVIGHGGEGKVYLAEIYHGSENEKSRVAVKHLKENSNEFEKEIRTITKIQHPHLVSLLGYCKESDQKILIYEYMEKGSLSDYVKSNSGSICLSWKQRLSICLGAARGLQHLHKETDEFPKGIIHRDVKPANILLGENWVAKVSDFGTFKLSVAGQTNSTVITDLKGTCGYYAPEQFRSFQITRKIDVYAFGVVLFEVLCRKRPWERGGESYYVGENEDLGLWAQENVDTKIEMEISNDSLMAYTDIIGRSLRSDPNRRPTMDGVIVALENALKHQEREDERIRNIRLKATRAPESASDGPGKGGNRSKKVHLVDLRRANNCEIMLETMRIPLADIISAIFAWDASAFEIDQVESLIRFCPTKDEMELLKGYKGEKEMLGKCEQFFMELMKVPRVDFKLRVLFFKMLFSSQVNDLRHNLTTINDAAREVKESTKLRQIMQRSPSLGNALNQGTARGSSHEFVLDSLRYMSDTRARNSNVTLMHYPFKLLVEKMPELLDLDEDLAHLEAVSTIQFESCISKLAVMIEDLENVESELTASENDGAISAGFREVFKSFSNSVHAEVQSLSMLYHEAERNADSLAKYFGGDPTRTRFEEVRRTLVVYVKMFKKVCDENEEQADAKKKNLDNEEQAAVNSLSMEEDNEVNSENGMKT